MENCNLCKAQFIEEIKLRLSIHFGTYTDKDIIKISDVFKLIDSIGEQIYNE
jgi:hypothetical protein